MTRRYFPRATSGGPATVTDAVTLRTAAVPTTSYVATDEVLVAGFNAVVFGLPYTNGDETSLQVKAQGSRDNGATWEDLQFKATQSAGLSEITPDGLNITKATISTAYGAATLANLALPPCDCAGFSLARLVIKSTGGMPTGTVGATASGSLQSVS